MRLVAAALCCCLLSACSARDGASLLQKDGSAPGGPADAGAARDGGAVGEHDAGTGDGSTGLLGALSADFRTNHVGFRPDDRKMAVLLGHPNTQVELLRTTDNAVAATYTSTALQTDPDSGDQVSTIDFSAYTDVGSYYLYLPAEKVRSYPFVVAPDAYDVVGRAAMKSFYFQRCNHDKALPYASDALPGAEGIGGQWLDGACHTTDEDVPAGPGSLDQGNLDLHGGWHDAGDYQKTLWDRGLAQLLFAYEVNPSAWRDGVLRLPESDNGIPDMLDELGWELDFYLRMQRPDGHFMSSVKGHEGTIQSPPSKSNERRVYFDATSPEGDGWSGGGVTLEHATANATAALAHAAIVYRDAGQAALGDAYSTAAARGWAWLSAQPASVEEGRRRLLAASAVYRMDASVASASAVVQAFKWSTWDDMLPYGVTPGESVIATAAWHTLLNSAAPAALKSTIKAAVAAAIVERAFAEPGVYGPLYGDASNGWDWGWGSNRAQGSYGANLLMALHTGATGKRTADEVRARAGQHLHYLLGLNPLSMVYFTNLAAYGAEHSSFQIYHSWWSHDGRDADHGNPEYNGKPAAVVEPMYPYHPADTQSSTYGPPPGLVPGGPNFYYSGAYDIANKAQPAYAYRDFSVACDWSGSACRAASWELTEPMAAYQGPVVLLLSFHMAGNQKD